MCALIGVLSRDSHGQGAARHSLTNIIWLHPPWQQQRDCRFPALFPVLPHFHPLLLVQTTKPPRDRPEPRHASQHLMLQTPVQYRPRKRLAEAPLAPMHPTKSPRVTANDNPKTILARITGIFSASSAPVLPSKLQYLSHFALVAKRGPFQCIRRTMHRSCRRLPQLRTRLPRTPRSTP